MSGNCELGRGLRRREKNATEGGAGRFEKTAPDARAAPPPEAHESLIGRKTVEEVPLTVLSSSPALMRARVPQPTKKLVRSAILPSSRVGSPLGQAPVGSALGLLLMPSQTGRVWV